jgi:hypothetical protein
MELFLLFIVLIFIAAVAFMSPSLSVMAQPPASGEVAHTATGRPARTYPSHVAGLAHANRPGELPRGFHAARHLKPGETLMPIREPDHEHSDNAVALYHGAVKVGYVPDRHSWVARALDKGQRVGIGITDVKPAENKDQIVFVALEISVWDD